MLVTAACSGGDGRDSATSGETHFPEMVVPVDNPMTAERIALGRYLFHDFRMSRNSERSCGICHEPAKGFTDGFSRAVGTTGETHTRNTLSLINVGYREQLNWRDPEMRLLEDQWHGPMFGEEPVEMGMTPDDIVSRLGSIARYPPMFAEVFPDDEQPLSTRNIGRALASFQRTIVGGDSAYDRWLKGEEDAMSDQAIAGLDVFAREGCDRCHGGIFFDQPHDENGSPSTRHGYANTGLYNVDGDGGYPNHEPGLIASSGVPGDMGRFRIPSLRGVAETGPWSHDGTSLSLAAVVGAYARGGRLVSHPDYAGDGATSPLKSPMVEAFDLTRSDEEALIAFLSSLSDHSLMARPDLQTPFCLMVNGEATNPPCESWTPIVD